MQANAQIIKVLLVEDDAEDAELVRGMLGKVQLARYEMDWAPTFQEGLARLRRGEHDVCLLDYYLGVADALDGLRTLRQAGCRTPIIVLTGKGNLEVDLAAMQADRLRRRGGSAPGSGGRF